MAGEVETSPAINLTNLLGFNKGGFFGHRATNEVLGSAFDIIVIGATEAGIASAVRAARMGRKVLIVSDNERIGWMTGWGINNQDVVPSKTPGVINGLTREFLSTVAQNLWFKSFVAYWRANGVGRPSWYRKAFDRLVSHPNLTILRNARLVLVEKTGTRITAIILDCDDQQASGRYTARVFVEGTAEGDLNRRVLSSISVGRESTALYGEAGAGILTPSIWDGNTTVDPYVTPGVPASGLLYGVDPGALGTVGAGDGRVMAFGYRVFLTSVPADKIPFLAPDMGTYSAAHYELLGRAMAANPTWYGHATLGLDRLFQFYPLDPDGTGATMGPTFMPIVDLNSGGAFSTNYPNNAECLEYLTATYTRRSEIGEKAKQHVLGLFHWILHSGDSRIPPTIVTALNAYGLSNKELTEYGGFSPQLYVREGVRAVGDFVLSLGGAVIGNGYTDVIGYGFYDHDSHGVRRLVQGGAVYYEGAQLSSLGTNYGYPIPMRVLFPKVAECTNLVLASQPSVSQMVWRGLRAIPSMMVIGEAAGVVAALASLGDLNVQSVPYGDVSSELDITGVNDGLVVDSVSGFVRGLVTTIGTWAGSSSRFGAIATQYATTAGNTGASKKFQHNIREPGPFRVMLAYSPSSSGDQGRATNLAVTVSHADGVSTRSVNQLWEQAGSSGYGGRWEELGVFTFRAGAPSPDFVLIDDAGSNGRLTVSAVKLVPLRN